MLHAALEEPVAIQMDQCRDIVHHSGCDLEIQMESLKKKCASKSEAILSLSQQLTSSQEQMNRYKKAAECFEKRMQQAEQSCKAVMQEYASFEIESIKEKETLTKENERLRQDVQRLVAENSSYKAEVKDIRSECKALRQKLARFEVEKYRKNEAASEQIPNATTAESFHEDGVTSRRGSMLLETFEKINAQIVDDIDGVLAENRYLKARLENAQEETGLTRAALKKYRRMVKGKIVGRSNSIEEEPYLANGERTTFGAYTAEQISRVLGSKSLELNDGDYRSLSAALLESCSDKLIALTHQRNANKILGRRVTELEAQLLQRNSEDKSPDRLQSKRVPFISVSVGVQCDVDQPTSIN
uniref:Coiled-coil domain-containing protein n=1 Tax=Ascaris lumbricoides TaxID=6252 RepID=A0A9J2P8K6_ASCLU